MSSQRRADSWRLPRCGGVFRRCGGGMPASPRAGSPSQLWTSRRKSADEKMGVWPEQITLLELRASYCVSRLRDQNLTPEQESVWIGRLHQFHCLEELDAENYKRVQILRAVSELVNRADTWTPHNMSLLLQILLRANELGRLQWDDPENDLTLLVTGLVQFENALLGPPLKSHQNSTIHAYPAASWRDCLSMNTTLLASLIAWTRNLQLRTKCPISYSDLRHNALHAIDPQTTTSEASEGGWTNELLDLGEKRAAFDHDLLLLISCLTCPREDDFTTSVETVDVVATKILDFPKDEQIVENGLEIVSAELVAHPNLTTLMQENTPEVLERLLRVVNGFPQNDKIALHMLKILIVFVSTMVNQDDEAFSKTQNICQGAEFCHFNQTCYTSKSLPCHQEHLNFLKQCCRIQHNADPSIRVDSVKDPEVVEMVIAASPRNALCPICDDKKPDQQPSGRKESGQQQPLPSQQLPDQHVPALKDSDLQLAIPMYRATTRPDYQRAFAQAQGSKSPKTQGSKSPKAQGSKSPKTQLSKTTPGAQIIRPTSKNKRSKRANRRTRRNQKKNMALQASGAQTTPQPLGQEVETHITPGDVNMVDEVWQCLHCQSSFPRQVLQLPTDNVPELCIPEIKAAITPPENLLPAHTNKPAFRRRIFQLGGRRQRKISRTKPRMRRESDSPPPISGLDEDSGSIRSRLKSWAHRRGIKSFSPLGMLQTSFTPQRIERCSKSESPPQERSERAETQEAEDIKTPLEVDERKGTKEEATSIECFQVPLLRYSTPTPLEIDSELPQAEECGLAEFEDEGVRRSNEVSANQSLSSFETKSIPDEC